MDQSSYPSYGGMDRPLFGETNKRDRYISYGLGIVTVAAVFAVLISACVKLVVANVLLAIIIILNCASNILLMYWYREGNLEPKFRNLIYFNFLVTLLLCITAFVIIFP